MVRRRVLVLDDDPQVTGLYSTALKGGGLDVIVCNSYNEARARLREETPDALLADVRVGEYNGLQAVMMFRAQSPDGLVVVATGHDDPTIRAEAAQLGATFMLKPVDITKLVALFKAIR